MITLTTPTEVNSVLGGSAPIAYDKLVVGPFTIDPIAMTISGRIRLTSSANADMQAIEGSLTINNVTALLEISVERLDFYRRVRLTGPQNTAVQNIIRDSQNAIESGLVSLGVVAGIQSAGA